MTSRQRNRGTPRGKAGTPPRETPTGRKLIKADSPTNSVGATHATEPKSPDGKVLSSHPVREEHDEGSIRGGENMGCSGFAGLDETSHVDVAEALLSLASRTERDSASLPYSSTTSLGDIPVSPSGTLNQQHANLDPTPTPIPKDIIRIPQAARMPSAMLNAPALISNPSEGSVYPSLPVTDASRHLPGEEVHRAKSPSTTLTEISLGTEVDDARALSVMSESERAAREESTGASGSDGPAMPGRFGR